MNGLSLSPDLDNSSYPPESSDLKPPIVPKPPRKTSQRPTHSCSECSRRKTKCDKVVPCGQCVKRGKSHLCKVDSVYVRKVDQTDPVDPSRLPTSDVRNAAFAELDTWRTTVDALRARIGSLEGILAQAFTPPPPQQQGYGTPQPFYDPLQDIYIQSPAPPPHQLPFPDTACSYVDPSSRPSTSTSTSTHHSSSFTVKPGQDLRGEEAEAEASAALEFLAQGRHQTGVAVPTSDLPLSHRLPPTYTFPTSPFLPSPTALYPTPLSLSLALPTHSLAESLLSHSLDYLNWQNASIHAPTFRREVAEFWSWGDRRVELVDPAWLAAYFALLVVGVGNLGRGLGGGFGISGEDRAGLAKRWFDCAMACLYRANFLQNHSIFAVQAIAILVVSGQDTSSSTILPTLLTTGISIAQDLVLHRMISDLDWETSMQGQPHEVRVKSLIGREMRKRIFWALAAQDWFGIAERRTYVVLPTQVTTPLPSNAHDEDLLRGQLVNRPPSEYTVVSQLLLSIQIARCLQSVFEHLDTNANPSYDFVLQVDERLQRILGDLPAWTQDGGPTIGMPPCVDWVRSTFRISSLHKRLMLHRPFLARAFLDPRYEATRRHTLLASRTILREAAHCPTNPLQSLPSQITAAATLVLLDLLQRSTAFSPSLDLVRSEVARALAVLQGMGSESAKRGVGLIERLVEGEKRGRRGRRGKRGREDEWGGTGKKMALEEICPPSSLGVYGAYASPGLFPLSSEMGCGGEEGGGLPREFLEVVRETGVDPLGFLEGGETGRELGERSHYLPDWGAQGMPWMG